MAEKSLLDDAAEAVYRDLDAVGGDPLKLAPEVQPIAILHCAGCCGQRWVPIPL